MLIGFAIKKVYCYGMRLMKRGMNPAHYVVMLFSMLLFFQIIDSVQAETVSEGQGTLGGVEELVEEKSGSNDYEVVELVKNGGFEDGLKFWKAGVFEYDEHTFPEFDEYFDCDRGAPWDKCKAAGWGYPKYGLTDLNNPGERDFYANVPAFVWGWRTGVSLEQDIDIPQAQEATLSFDAKGFSQTQLHIYVRDKSNGELSLINQLVINGERWKSGDMIHREYDMTGYIGKPITLLLVASEAVIPQQVEWEETATTVYLDDISLTALVPVGSSSTFDLNGNFWIMIAIPVIAGIALAITITSTKKWKVLQKPTDSSKQTPSSGASKLTPDSTQYEDEPILETGKTPSTIGKQVKESAEPPSETELREEILNNDIIRYLLLLYEADNGTITGDSEVVRKLTKRYAQKGEKPPGSLRESVKSEMVDLEHQGLVKITLIHEDAVGRKTHEYKITELGKEFMKRALDDKTTSWREFLEKYSGDIHSKK